MRNGITAPGHTDEGNEFRYDDPHWIFNLSTKPYIAAGTYTVTIMSGDDSEYILDDCMGTFVRLQ
jgi:hypothetical protein